MKVELVAKTLPLLDKISTEEFTAYIARIGKIKENPNRLLRYLIQHKHWSPFEHSYFTFKLETSRAMGRELLRHRSFTFQELSQRYEEVLDFEPIELRKEHPTNRQSSTEVFNPKWEDYYIGGTHDGENYIANGEETIKWLLNQTKRLYQILLDNGVAKECARMILPECTRTTILMSGNVRSWLHFLMIRNDDHAQKEVRLIAQEIENELIKEIPISIEMYKEQKHLGR
jgi:thymidylate synthase (FAD)